MRTTAIFGPPGTGKTASLVEIIGSLDRSNMAVVSFSRAAAQELTSRIKDVPAFVGTLHSLCFKSLELDRGKVVSDLRGFRTFIGAASDELDQAVEIGQIAKRKKAKVIDVYSSWSNLSTSFDYVEQINASYDGWKKHFGLLDFDDMIEQAIGKVHKFDVVVVDEAQDLSKMQWAVIRKMVTPKGKIIIAGDDDQAIFSWAGAYPHGMRDMADDKLVLTKSYRVPKSVHAVAQTTVKRIKDRQDKVYSHRDGDHGYFEVVGEYDPFIKDHTVLCRDRYVIKDVERELISRCIPYKVEGPFGPGLFLGKAAQIKKAIETKDAERLQKLRGKMSTYGKAVVDAGEIPDWRSAIDADEETVWYLERTASFNEPKVIVSTIHQQKGKEMDHAVIMAKCSPRVESMQERVSDFDDEVRVWYVALTRAKKGVTFVGNNAFTDF
jgi:DNA helicase-2/ATP-dependent DNA helicase PcrA